MGETGGLVVYVTSHGFGHLNRTVSVINCVSPAIPITIRCHPDLFGHWRERLRRPAALEAHVSDAGAVNPPGDSAATDGPATLDLAARVHAEAREKIEEEADRLRDLRASAVLCDAPPLPLVAARRAGASAFLLANFTWSQIYAPHAKKIGAPARALVAEIRGAYRHATGVFRAEPALKLTEFGRGTVFDVGMVLTPGRDRRAELRERIGLEPGHKLVYFYIGRYGQSDLGWHRLESLGARGIHFVGFHPAPVGGLPNLHVVRAKDWTGADLAASSDAMVVKAGYGTACESMAAGTPMIYPPRTGFAEHRALDRTLRAWGGGVPASARAFAEFRIGRLLDRAFALKPAKPPFSPDGASRVAERLTAMCLNIGRHA